jgi:predicted nucleotidyltransferase
MTHQMILHGIAGSTAHGLAREGSDQDHHGVFGYSTDEFWDFTPPNMSMVGHEPYDYTHHEVQKFLSLALKSNPTVLEVLWLPEYLEKEDHWGNELIALRQSLLSERHVRAAFGGYAYGQFQKMANRGDETFSSDTKNRTWKHARHMFRLLEMGQGALETGDITVVVKDPQWYWDLEQRSINSIEQEFYKRIQVFNECKNVLPEEPDPREARDYLYSYRETH